MRQEMPLHDVVTSIIQSMEDTQYSSGTIYIFRGVFSRLQKLAQKREEEHYSSELGQAFIEDCNYSNGDYCHSRYLYHCRCVQFVESYIGDGQIDWSIKKLRPEYFLANEEYADAKNTFESLMTSSGLKENTKDGYRRLVHYFLKYLEDKGCSSFAQIRSGDVVAFITLVCKEHYQSTSLRSNLPGLRMFLRMFEITGKFEAELPERVPKKKEILEVYTDEEHDRIIHYLESSSEISLRDKAVCLVALETGLRAVDICGLKLSDIDWANDHIHIVQEKTGKALNIPLAGSFGNAIADYLLSERPNSGSEHVFLSKSAPFAPMSGHASCYKILFNAVTNAGVKTDGRVFGTRITRHSFASRLLRRGIPLPVISEALGHGDPNSVMIYLSTDDAKLAECTLPLPGKEDSHDD